MADIIRVFAELGLEVNLDKTQLLVHPAMYDQGVRFFEDDLEHVGFRCKWVTKGELLA